MSNAYDKASLVMIPTAQKEGKVYSAKPTDGSGDFTFSRGADTATRVNEQGYIEKERGNLLLQSNTFSDAPWARNNTSVTSGQSGYDGSLDAWKLQSSGGINRVVQLISNNDIYTFSVYAKSGTTDWMRINILQSGGNANNYYDIANGLKGASPSSPIIDDKIESVGNGWYRISIVSDGSITQIRIQTAVSDGNETSVSGDNIYIQDAQLEKGLVATNYIETTTVPVYSGILDNTPRLDYSNGATCPSLLLEPQRTNLITNSNYFEEWYVDSNVSYSVNNAISPEGLINATKVTATSTRDSWFRDLIYTNAGDNVFSIFAKYEDCQYIVLSPLFFTGGDGARVWFDIQNGVKGGSIGDAVTYDIEDYGNGWYRCYVVWNVDAGDLDGYCHAYLSSTDESFNVIKWNKRTFLRGSSRTRLLTQHPTYLLMVQVLQGRGMSAVVRVMHLPLTIAKGCCMVESSALANDGTNRMISLSDTSTNNHIRIYPRFTDNRITIAVKSGNANQYVFIMICLILPTLGR